MSNTQLGLFWSKGHPNGGFEQVRELSEAEAQEVQAASSRLHTYTNKPVFVVQSETYRSVVEAVDDTMSRIQSLGPNGSSGSGVAEMGSRVSIWLQATRMVLDQTEADVKRSFGRTSPESSQWESLVSRLEKEERGFLLLRQVRNFLHSRPVNVTASLTTEEAGDGGLINSGTLELRESELREDRQLREWLDRHPTILQGGFELLPLVESMQLAIEKLKLFRLRAELPDVLAAAAVIRRYSEEAFDHGDPAYSWPVVFEVDDQPGSEGWRMDNLSFLPIDLLLYLPDTPDPTSLTIPGSRGDEQVGPESIRMRRSYESFSTRIVIHTQAGSIEGEARVWSNRIGPGWGATVFLDGHVQPGWVSIETEEGHRARAALDSINYRGVGDTTMWVAVLVGRGAAPPRSQLTHPYRMS